MSALDFVQNGNTIDMTRCYVTMGGSAIKTYISKTSFRLSPHIYASLASQLSCKWKQNKETYWMWKWHALCAFQYFSADLWIVKEKIITSIPLTVKFVSWLQYISFGSCIILFILKYPSEKLFTNNLVLIKLEAKELINCQDFSFSS